MPVLFRWTLLPLKHRAGRYGLWKSPANPVKHSAVLPMQPIRQIYWQLVEHAGCQQYGCQSFEEGAAEINCNAARVSVPVKPIVFRIESLPIKTIASAIPV